MNDAFIMTAFEIVSVVNSVTVCIVASTFSSLVHLIVLFKVDCLLVNSSQKCFSLSCWGKILLLDFIFNFIQPLPNIILLKIL